MRVDDDSKQRQQESKKKNGMAKAVKIYEKSPMERMG